MAYGKAVKITSHLSELMTNVVATASKDEFLMSVTYSILLNRCEIWIYLLVLVLKAGGYTPEKGRGCNSYKSSSRREKKTKEDKGKVSYYLTQFLIGRGYFNEILVKIQEDDIFYIFCECEG